MMKNYIIVDDEPLAHQIIGEYAKDLTFLNKVENCYSAFEALDILQRKSVDLVFLDINMPKLSGFDLLETLSNPPKIIVTSAYKEYALEGYELNVVDYLLKPFSYPRFLKAIDKVIKVEKTNIVGTKPSSSAQNHSVFLKGDKKVVQVFLKDILYIKALGNYSVVYIKDSSNKKVMIHESLNSILKILGNDDFLRIHKSYIIAKSKISEIEGNRIKIDDIHIPIGQTYKINLSHML